METAALVHAATAPLQRAPPPPSPGPPVLSRLPATLSGPVRARRRRVLRRQWEPATAHLKGTALVVTSASGAVVALDVHDVVRVAADRVHIRSEAPPAAIDLRLVDRPRQWIAALEAVATARSPRLADFRVVSPLGKGGGGTVFLVRENHPVQAASAPLAMKVVQKHDVFHTNGSLRHALDERVVLELVRGFPFVITLRHAFQTETALYMVSDFCQGGDLRTLLRRHKRARLSEQRARPIMAQIVLALEHIHSLNVIYRDIKPENVLFTSTGDVRLCDFGLSKVLSTGRFGRTKSFCGSTSYMSPQIVSGKTYGISTDLWSLGALFYRMLVGRAPFDEPANMGARNDPAHIERRIQLDDLVLPSHLSKAAREMLEALLLKSEEERLNLQDLKEALFFKDIDWDIVLQDGYDRASRPADTLMGEELENFDAERLVSHGVALEDREYGVAPTHRRRTEDKSPLDGRTAFLRRQTSRMTGFSVRKRSELMQRKPSATSIVGFGFSSASDGSRASPNPSDTDTSNSVRSS